MNRLSNRLDNLERASGAGSDVIVWYWQGKETEQQALARWHASHPGRDLKREGADVMYITWLPPN